MATFDKHTAASDQFHEDMGVAGDDAIQAMGDVLRSVGASLGGNQAKESPESIAADAVVGAARTHSKFHTSALNALARAVKALRKR